METYELTLVLAGKATPAKKKEAVNTVETLVKVAKGEVKENKELGDKELAYPIKKNEVGTFLYFTLNLPKSSVGDIGDKLRVNEQFIRYLWIRAK